MELSNSAPVTTSPTNIKTPAETESPDSAATRLQLTKPFPTTNGGLLKRHPPLHHHHPTAPAAVVVYKECLKNHAAAMGAHALDGCGEFMPSPAASATDPTSLKCAACGCHRNFHRRDTDHPHIQPSLPPPLPALEYQPLHRHHPPPPPESRGHGGSSSPHSPSPPPISSTYYPSAPHVLLALSHGETTNMNMNMNMNMNTQMSNTHVSSISGRKRFRTRFTQEQKEKMLALAEKLEWKMQRKDEDLINESCKEISVDKGVFKVWMHNNKNNYVKKDFHEGFAAGNGGGATTIAALHGGDSGSGDSGININDQGFGTNGSSSS